jgi:predicted membrane protein
MKKAFTILAIIASFLAIILAVLPVSNLAIIPAIIALIFGLIAFYLSKKSGHVKKIIQFTLFLSIISISIVVYKALFTATEIGNTEKLIEKEKESEEEAIEELEGLELDDLELENISIDE